VGDFEQLRQAAVRVHDLYDRLNLKERGRVWTREEVMLGSTTGVRAYVETREEFTVQLCPWPTVTFPPRVGDYSAARRIEWFNAFDVAWLVTGRRPRFG